VGNTRQAPKLLVARRAAGCGLTATGNRDAMAKKQAKAGAEPTPEKTDQGTLTPAMRARFQEIWRGMDLAVRSTIEQDLNQIPDPEHRALWEELVRRMMHAAEALEAFRSRSGL